MFQVQDKLAAWVRMVRSKGQFRKLSINGACLGTKAIEFHNQFIDMNISSANQRMAQSVAEAASASIESKFKADAKAAADTKAAVDLESGAPNAREKFKEPDRIRGFIQRFVRRHHVVFQTLHGEATGVFVSNESIFLRRCQCQ